MRGMMGKRSGRKRDKPVTKITGPVPTIESSIDKLATLKRGILAMGKDHRLSSQLGILYIEDKIGSVHFLAGEAIAQLAERYFKIKGIRIGRPGAGSMQPSIPGTSNTDYDVEHVEKVEKEFKAAFKAIKSDMQGLVFDVCVNDEYCPIYMVGHLRTALRDASPHLRLEGRKKNKRGT